MIRSAILVLSVVLAPSVARAVEPSPVTKRERALVAVVNLSIRAHAHRLLYRYEENRASMKIRRDLGKAYGRVWILEKNRATRENFLRALRDAAADPSIRAVDAIVYLHGTPGKIAFVDTGYASMADLRDEILTIGSTKFRALYSDACWGESHIDDWLRAGFRAASGAIDQDSNWSKDLGRWMRTWKSNGTFGRGIARANRVKTTGFTDWVIGGDSRKIAEGELAITLATPIE